MSFPLGLILIAVNVEGLKNLEVIYQFNGGEIRTGMKPGKLIQANVLRD